MKLPLYSAYRSYQCSNLYSPVFITYISNKTVDLFVFVVSVLFWCSRRTTKKAGQHSVSFYA